MKKIKNKAQNTMLIFASTFLIGSTLLNDPHLVRAIEKPSDEASNTSSEATATPKAIVETTNTEPIVVKSEEPIAPLNSETNLTPSETTPTETAPIVEDKDVVDVPTPSETVPNVPEVTETEPTIPDTETVPKEDATEEDKTPSKDNPVEEVKPEKPVKEDESKDKDKTPSKDKPVDKEKDKLVDKDKTPSKDKNKPTDKTTTTDKVVDKSKTPSKDKSTDKAKTPSKQELNTARPKVDTGKSSDKGLVYNPNLLNVDASKLPRPSVSNNTINSGTYTELSNWANFDIRSENNGDVTIARMNQVAKVMGKSQKMRDANIGTLIMKYANHYNINAGILFSFTMYETGWGSSSQFLNLNNTGGMECMSGYACVGRWAKFDSIEDSIERKARLLSGHMYVQGGLTTLWQIINRYAPSFENDVNLYINSIGQINEKYLGQRPLSIRNTRFVGEIQAQQILSNVDNIENYNIQSYTSDGSSSRKFEPSNRTETIRQALLELQGYNQERKSLIAKIEQDTVTQKRLEKENKKLIKKAKKEERALAKAVQASKDYSTTLNIRQDSVTDSIDVYTTGDAEKLFKD